ncbi:hypothetical protein LTR62_005164 [Meristemomyces frigidus]|uniref:Uncharacterized protein n=1 Tax=Meristemomyces frigidus TaxID=1508187 RepID=A0AAN7YNR2_9PEZI|nr:hypothetical protein LTR62_005164 [Meristemomyces frigidus]
MSDSGFRTAIDDSFEPNFFPVPLPDTRSREPYNGPRSGHWSVASDTGSAIDDRCPTIYNYGHLNSSQRATGSEPIRPIEADLLKKLGRATYEAEKLKVKVKADVAASIQSESTRESAKTKEKASKGFFVPARVDGRDLKPAKPDNKQNAGEVKKSTKHVAQPQPTAASVGGPASAASSGPSFKQSLRAAVMSVSRHSENHECTGSIASSGGYRGDSEWSHASGPESAAPSGAISAKSMRDAIKSINKNSEVVGQGWVAESWKPASAQGSSKFGTQQFVRSEVVQKDRIYREDGSTHAWENVYAHSEPGYPIQARYHMSTPTPTSQGYEKHRTGIQPDFGNGFKAVGEGVFRARPANIQTGSGRHSGHHDHSGSRGVSSTHGRNTRTPDNPQNATVFAGKGWVSPHPLSATPSVFGSPPQSRVAIPAGVDKMLPKTHRGEKEISFQEWQMMREAGYDVGGSQFGSAKGFTAIKDESVVSEMALSVARMFAAGSGSESQKCGRESSIGRASAGSHGWSEKDGEVHLRMPWDGK